ncbi:UTRA domain-containing protein [Variovorax sp. LT1R20]|uniref:UTRA domain-containing protein n=1 Tax=Variovorax sp. LT1R20 TaxID=3443729 RepID=UPI003F48B5E7
MGRLWSEAELLAPLDVAAALQLAEGTTVLKVVRVRATGRTPILHSVVYLPEAVGRRFAKAAFGSAALSELLQDKGIRYDRIEMVTRATLADLSIGSCAMLPSGPRWWMACALATARRAGPSSPDSAQVIGPRPYARQDRRLIPRGIYIARQVLQDRMASQVDLRNFARARWLLQTEAADRAPISR